MRAETRTAVLVWAGLLVLLAITISASFAPIGPLKVVVNIGIALTKAALVFWFYMHLREESGLVRLVAIGALAWLLIMFLLMSSDYVTRGN